MSFYYKWADNNAGYVKVASHLSNHDWMTDQGWQDSANNLKAPRIRRTNAQIQIDEMESVEEPELLEEAADDGDSSTSDQGSVAEDSSSSE